MSLVYEVRRTEKPLHMTSAVWFLVGHLAPAGQSNEQVHVAVNSLRFTIGRRPDASLCLPFRTVSSNHAELIQFGGKIIIRDLGSTNEIGRAHV